MKLEAFQCPVCLSTHIKVVGDLLICNSCGNSYTKKQADSQMFIDLRIANSHRQFAEYSKAKAMYEDIIAKYDDEDLTPAYWGLFLCDQQVMLEQDNNGQIFPSFFTIKETPIQNTAAYKRFAKYLKKTSPEKIPEYNERVNIIENAREKAKIIAESTKPYDVFICFKKTQLNSDFVTKDYDLANELYRELSDKYKIFYSEKSLKGIRVREYEPNIYYGLYSAKVMLLICSKKEFLESHWMQNEWKRFLEINKHRNNVKNCIIPIFIDDFTPDDLPFEISNLQGLKYGISLMKDLEKELESIINPVDINAEQQKQIELLAANQKKILESLAEKEKNNINNIIDEANLNNKIPANPALESLFKLIRVTIEDLSNFDEAEKLVRKAQLMDAEHYLGWYYKLLIDFKSQSVLELVMHDNFRDCVNYKLMVKYAQKSQNDDFVNSIEKAREEYLKVSADKVNSLLQKLDDNPRPTEEDITEIKNIYETIPKDAKKYLYDIKVIIPNARAKMRENKIQDFNIQLTKVEKKEHPNYDDIINLQENYKTLSDDEKDLAGDINHVIQETSSKMKMNKVNKLKNMLIELDNMDVPPRDILIRVEKEYAALENEYKRYVSNFQDILLRGYDRKYKADAKTLNEYLTKLPREKVPNREIYQKLENRYRALPKKFRILISNINLLDDYYDRLIESEGGHVEEKKQEKKVVEKPKEAQKPKKKFWLW